MKLHFNELEAPSKEASPPMDSPSKGEVHLWSHFLSPNDPFAPHARFVLSSTELEKSDKFHFEKDKRAYQSGHVFIRRVISSYTGIDPVNLEISQDKNHKPYLENSSIPIHFNISHSRNLILLAIGNDIEVGVDTEFIKEDFDVDEFANSNYHPNEKLVFDSLKGQNQSDFFYRIWTYKEAFLKLTGEGINDHLNQIDFSGEKASIKYSKGEPRNLWLCSWKQDDDYICSLACGSSSAPDLKFYESSFIEPAINEDI